jgi:hypothetical protein
MNFKSDELKNAIFVEPNSTYTEKSIIDVQNLRNLLRNFVLSKNIDLVNLYDLAAFNKKVSSSGLENLEFLFESIRKNLLDNFINDKNKQAIINLMFDNMLSNLKLLKIINTELSSDEINTIILGFLIKNFI